MNKTDFCIVGFPKCGTSATARFLERSPACHLSKMSGYEAPYFHPPEKSELITYESGKRNGHKFSAYIYSMNSLQNIMRNIELALLIINVRPAASALLSWRDMHRRIAIKAEPESHFVNETPASRSFYMNGSIDEYYRQYADTRLDYAVYIQRLLEAYPDANYMVISQKRLASDAAEVMRRVHERLGEIADSDYLEALPTKHKPTGVRDVAQIQLDEQIVTALEEKDERLKTYLASLDQDRVLIADNGL